MKSRVFTGLTVLISLSSFAFATTRIVPDDYPDIGAAVQACNDGDEVIVNDGVYSGDGNRDITVNKNITIKSENGPDNCIIDCNSVGKLRYRAFVVRSDVIIAGFTIINGYAEEGGAIIFEHCNSGPEIINCVFKNNFAERRGGAILFECYDSNPEIINCVFSNNISENQGGALFYQNTSPTVINSRFSNNSASGGGAIYCERTELFMNNCTVSHNIATGPGLESGGGGIFCWRESNVSLKNCLISENIADGTPEGCGGGIRCMDNSSLVICNSKIKSNTARSEHNSTGGGILCSNCSSLVLQDSVVADNICEGSDSVGGGIYYEQSSNTGAKCTITGCTIEGNTAKTMERSDRSYGGGIFLRDARLLISKGIIRNNSASTGAGLMFESSDSLIWGSIIGGNSSQDRNRYSGGGIQCMNSNTFIGNCTIVGNALFGLYCQSGNTNVTNSILYYNGHDKQEQVYGSGHTSVTYSDVQTYKYTTPYEPSWPGEGNINADPCFIDSGYWDANGTPKQWEDDFWVEGNYRLLSTSPCIDTGKLSAYQLDGTDIDNNPRIAGSNIDMGAYEFRNNIPVANAGPDQEAYAWIDNIAKVVLDGSASYDADGQPLSYLWSWVIDSNSYDVNGVSPVIDFPIGRHTVTLVVNDSMADSGPDEVVVTVIEPLKSELWVYPHLIYQGNRPNKIIAWLVLPGGITKEQVDTDKKFILYPSSAEALSQHTIEYKQHGEPRTAVWAMFDANGLIDTIEGQSKIEILIVGNLKSGQCFYGGDTIWIKR